MNSVPIEIYLEFLIHIKIFFYKTRKKIFCSRYSATHLFSSIFGKRCIEQSSCVVFDI